MKAPGPAKQRRAGSANGAATAAAATSQRKSGSGGHAGSDDRPEAGSEQSRRPPRAILFDFYNTLGVSVLPDAGHLIATLARFGHRFAPNAPGAAIGRAWQPFDGAEPVEHLEFSQSAEHYQRWRLPIERAWLAALGLDPCPEEILYAVCAATDDAASYRLFAGVLPALRALRQRGYRLGVVSNWGWQLESILEREGLLPLLESVTVSARCGYRKPHAEIYRIALRATGTTPAETLFVGDNPHADLAGPAALGMRAVLIDRTAAPGASGCLTNLDELVCRIDAGLLV